MNQKYLVRDLKFVRKRYVIAVKLWSRIHSGLIISSFALRKSNKRRTIYPARKKAEKNAPVVAKLLLKVRLDICVKILIFISISEK